MDVNQLNSKLQSLNLYACLISLSTYERHQVLTSLEGYCNPKASQQVRNKMQAVTATLSLLLEIDL